MSSSGKSRKTIGIGIDIVDINDFERIQYNKKPNFYKKIFLSSEINYCLKYKNPYPHFAGKFALKEAVKKAISKKISMLDIETSHSKKQPFIKIKNKVDYSFLASISHEKNMAVGIVICEKILNK